MFRSHVDSRHLPSLTKKPSMGNNMARFSQDGMVSAPCVPAAIHPLFTSKARLKNTVVDRHSVTSFSETLDSPDEISAALGLDAERILEYKQPEPAACHDKLIGDFRHLTLEDSANSTSSIYTSRNISRPRQDVTGSLSCPGSRGGANDNDTSPLEAIHFWRLEHEKDLPLLKDRPRSADFKPTVVHVESPQTANSCVASKTITGRFLDHASVPQQMKRCTNNSSSNSNSKTKNRSRPRPSRESPRELVRALVSSARQECLSTKKSPIKNEPGYMAELQYLVTYNLVNNFYYNLVSWSLSHNAVAIAIDSRAYWWDGSSQVRDMHIERPGLAPVTCVTCSLGDAVAVAYADGLLSIYPEGQTQFPRYRQRGERQGPVSRQFISAVQCVQWFPSGARLITGHQSGAVMVLSYDGSSLVEECRLHGFSQQICGIALSRDCQQVAVGANENLAIVWDLGQRFSSKVTSATPPEARLQAALDTPTETCRLRHTSAVKGISFCPWAPHLLATGGGSNDRHLRFWHTRSGTLLSEVDTQRQITSVFWSSSYKQILVTFGYSGGSGNTEDLPSNTVAAAIYEYPEPKIVAEAHARDPLRALSATVSPDETKVAIAANDGTVRVFGLWERRPYPLTQTPPSVLVGSFQSAIVESVEGVDFRVHDFR